MRKYVLGIAIGIVFLAYSTILRHQHSEPILAPTSLSQTSPTNTSTSKTGISSSGSSTAQSTKNTTSTDMYKDGTYTGSVENAYYGNVQVSATIVNGKITSVDFLQAPDENPNSIYVNQQADPYLKQEAIQAQSSKVSVITGATFTSQAFIQSLASALSQAQQS